MAFHAKLVRFKGASETTIFFSAIKKSKKQRKKKLINHHRPNVQIFDIPVMNVTINQWMHQFRNNIRRPLMKKLPAQHLPQQSSIIIMISRSGPSIPVINQMKHHHKQIWLIDSLNNLICISFDLGRHYKIATSIIVIHLPV